ISSFMLYYYFTNSSPSYRTRGLLARPSSIRQKCGLALAVSQPP
ncbi:19303_t:CDS:2, partial [Racocetra persica]